MNNERLKASFRDPSGFLFRRNGKLYRQVNQIYTEEYKFLMDSGLYFTLVESGLLIPHREVDIVPAEPEAAGKVIQPEQLPFISYPYEWSFGLLKAGALATLSIQKRALKAGMTLKDASAYNIQFYHGKAALIDSLSFERYREGQPWAAYRQFCQHFLAPLALMAYTDVRLNQILKIYIDGIPLDLASGLLPFRTWLNPALLTHIHLHARLQQRYSDTAGKKTLPSSEMSKRAMEGLIDSLRAAVRKLKWDPQGTEWGAYYQITNYSDAAFNHKKELVSAWITRVNPGMVWDLGANDGTFSRLASQKEIFTAAFDIDPAAVEKNYRLVRANKERNLIPLLLDLTNPSPSIGWHHRERDSFLERGPADLVLALALVHHLAISNNVPLPQVVDFFADAGSWLVIEFVPKSDSQVQKLLSSRKDIFHQYTREEFEAAFRNRYEIHETEPVDQSERTLYLMERKKN